MNDEFTARQRALMLRLAGRPVPQVCSAPGRSEARFHNRWRRDLAFGVEGLDDLTRACRHVARRIPPELERAILSIRRRRGAHSPPANNDHRSGARAILAELKALDLRPLPRLRTIDRVLQRHGLTAPRVRLAPLLPRREYPAPKAQQSNPRHAADRVGPISLKGRRQRDSISVCKEAFDGAVCLRLASSRRRDEVLTFLGERGKSRGRPAPVRFDNAREIRGGGPAARYLSRLIRLCLRFDVAPVFIPPGEPPFNGSVANVNGWFQPRLPQRRFPRPGDLRRELARLEEVVNTEHVHPRLGGLTPAQHRRGLRPQKLPARFVVPAGRLPVAAGRVTFIRRVRVAGTVKVLSPTFRVGKRHRGLYVRLVRDTQRGRLSASLEGRPLKRWPYELTNR